ncbi:MAG: DUF3800 domain-containing protein [Deltaproteobacteria bacterium]|nr:DUF3800 domain-containing protein [Deltaproteobacteria bacterium]MCL5276806.1 DUF3800 domain-containing protein [Deltaproteobacteria bacterium]
MYVCYVDEAGDTGTLIDPLSDIQPLIAICGLITNQRNIMNLTHDFLNLKRTYFPNKFSRSLYLDCMKIEIKGSYLRKFIKGEHDQRRFALRFLDQIITLLEKYDVSILGHISIKPIGLPFKGRAVYTSSIQHIATSFQNFLTQKFEFGIIIADSRDKEKNANVSHSIFTQKYKPKGDSYNRLLEMPLYGHSDNHAGLQLIDLIASAILFPVAATAYCSKFVKCNLHYDPKYLDIRTAFGQRIKKLQYRYQDYRGWWYGGIKVSDPTGHQNAEALFS